MADLRNIVIVLIVAALFTIFVFSFNAAVNEGPQYERICKTMYGPSIAKPYYEQPLVNCTRILQPTRDEQDACAAQEGNIQYYYDEYGCATSWTCDTCQVTFNDAQDQYRFWQFIIAAGFGLIAILVGLLLPYEKNALNEWIGTGFLLGGLLTLFIGTGLYFTTFYKWLRPIVILAELCLVIFIAYRKFKGRANTVAKKQKKRK